MEHLAAFSQNTQDQQQAQQNVTQLEFTQAMNDFKTMFPCMDEDVIEIVLRANQGAVDATIDQLLQMTGEEAQKGTTTLPVRSSEVRFLNTRFLCEKLKTFLFSYSQNQIPPKYTPPPSYQQAVPHNVNHLAWTDVRSLDDKVVKEPINKQLFGQGSLEMATNGKRFRSWQLNPNCLAAKFRWNPPLLGLLPGDFLRVDPPTSNSNYGTTSSALAIAGQSVSADTTDMSNPSTSPLSSALLQQRMQENERQRSQLSSNLNDVETAQFLEDERIAIFLQNEEFVAELRRNKEFMSALHYDAMKGRSSNTGASHSSGNGFCNENYTGDLHPSDNYEHLHHESDADFKEKLKNMGEATRRKFAQVSFPNLVS